MTIADEIFELWTRAGAAWGDWAKPVLFAHLDGARPSMPPFKMADAVPLGNATAVVVDLPGVISIAFGVALAAAGHAPVPLFNAVPGDREGLVLVDVWPIVDALAEATPTLRAIVDARPPATRSPADRPPAFVLDAARRVAGGPVRGLEFDNRSLVLPTDFPSAALLRSRGIDRVVVMQSPADARPQDDLEHVLRRWQDAGLAIDVLDPFESPPTRRAIVVPRPRWYRAMWYAAIARLRFRPHPLGGFGGTLPLPSTG